MNKFFDYGFENIKCDVELPKPIIEEWSNNICIFVDCSSPIKVVLAISIFSIDIYQYNKI